MVLIGQEYGLAFNRKVTHNSLVNFSTRINTGFERQRGDYRCKGDYSQSAAPGWECASIPEPSSRAVAGAVPPGSLTRLVASKRCNGQRVGMETIDDCAFEGGWIAQNILFHRSGTCAGKNIGMALGRRGENLLCMVNGGDPVLESLRRQSGVDAPGEHTGN